ncbi:hypothetical protein [Exiguobacterium undae]|uniref:hypothetical protein n=1 Tax=Exiguobacterium undae TaxID=169177 RepID=UPI00384DAA5E
MEKFIQFKERNFKKEKNEIKRSTTNRRAFAYFRSNIPISANSQLIDQWKRLLTQQQKTIGYLATQNIQYREETNKLKVVVESIRKHHTAIPKIFEMKLNEFYESLDSKIIYYLENNIVSEDVEDDYELYTLHSESLKKVQVNASKKDFEKEINFLEKNLKFFKKIDNEDEIIMLISLLTISKKRLKAKALKRSFADQGNVSFLELTSAKK